MKEEKFDKKEYDMALQKKMYDKMTCTILKGGKEIISKAAKKAGKKSLNEYIVEAIQEKLKREDSGMVYMTEKDKINKSTSKL